KHRATPCVLNRQESLASTTRVATYGQVHEAYLRQAGEKEEGRTKRRDEEACSHFLHAHAPPLNYPDKSVGWLSKARGEERIEPDLGYA
ncbi:MAG: hypothetical protein ACQESW_07975, partial [Bacteroidota bacterium]